MLQTHCTIHAIPLLLRLACIVGLLALHDNLNIGNSSSDKASQATQYQEIDLTNIAAITRRSQWDQMASHISVGATVVLGENIFDANDTAAISYWCRVVTAKSAIAYIGVRDSDGAGEVWKFDKPACPDPRAVYKVRIGVPGVTGGFLPDMGDWYQPTRLRVSLVRTSCGEVPFAPHFGHLNEY